METTQLQGFASTSKGVVYTMDNPTTYQLLVFYNLRQEKKGDRVMKKSILVTLAIGLTLAFSTVAMAGVAAGTGIRATKHDLSSLGASSTWGASEDTKDRICIYCHAPHNSLNPTTGADAAFDYLPLWNHAVTTNVNNFVMYSNGSYVPGLIDHQFNGADSIGQPGGVSLLCLSCHDGSVGVNTYGFAPSTAVGGLTPKNMAGTALIGSTGDLSNHHPIGFNYDDVAAVDQEIRLSTVALPNDALYGVKAGGPVTIADLLSADGKMECISCHDVHNTKNGGSKFTWVDDQGSRLCFTCHVKDNTTQLVGPEL